MNKFNYNPFTWEPEGKFIFYYDKGTGRVICQDLQNYPLYELSQRAYGIYKTSEDAKLAFEIAREAILKNVND